MLWSKAYFNGIADVYYESVWNCLHRDPLAYMFDLKTSNVFILQEYGNRAAIGVWTNTHDFIRPGASWVIIKTHAKTHLAVSFSAIAYLFFSSIGRSKNAAMAFLILCKTSSDIPWCTICHFLSLSER